MIREKKQPLRKCVGCGQQKEKRELVRIIRTSEKDVILDRTGRANGRGAYICPSPSCLERAHKSKALERSLRAQVDGEVYEQIRKEIEEMENGRH